MNRLVKLLVAMGVVVGLAWAGKGGGNGNGNGGGGSLTNPAFVYIGKELGAKDKGQRLDELFLMSSDGAVSQSVGV
ncbi:MAG: hypothetical protein ACYS0E_05230, partial [Planctomycetota bacterium]